MVTKHVPMTIEAKTKPELITKMNKLRFKYSKNFHFFDFQFAQGKWHCWFEVPLKDWIDNNADK